MPADPSIYGMLRTPQPGPGPLELAGQGLQIRHMLDQGQLSALQRQQLEKAMADEQRIGDLFARGNVKPEELMAVSPSKGMAYQKSMLDNKKVQGDIDRGEIDRMVTLAKFGRDSLTSVTDQGSYDAWRRDAAGRGIQAAQNAPAIYDPAWQRQNVMDADKWIATQEGQKGRDVTIRGQNMTDARARAAQAETGRHNLVVEGKADYGEPKEVTGADGKPRLVMQNKKTGQMVDANTLQPVTGIGPKAGESAQKQLTGVATVKQGIADYRNALKEWSASDIVKPGARARMGTIYNNMLLQAKEAYNLGVLNGPDYQILQEVITSPASLKGGITSKEALDDQARQLDEIMTRVGAAVSQTQSGITPPAGPTPPQPPGKPPAATRAEIDAELRRRGITR